MINQFLLNIDHPDLVRLKNLNPTKIIEVTMFFNSLDAVQKFGNLMKPIENNYPEDVETSYVNIGNSRFGSKNIVLLTWI